MIGTAINMFLLLQPTPVVVETVCTDNPSSGNIIREERYHDIIVRTRAVRCRTA